MIDQYTVMTAMDRESDEAVMARSLGCPEAFRIVFDRHFDAVWAYARRRVGASFADDTTNETFARAFAGRRSFRQGHSARPWLLGIASNICASHWRSEERRLRAYARSGLLTHTDLGEDGLLARIDALDRSQVIAEAVASLNPNERETLLLAALADLDNREIAEALGITPNAVGVRLSRIRSRLGPLFENAASGGIT